MDGLSRRFAEPSEFGSFDSYNLLPFRFIPFDDETYFCSNEVGEWLFLSKPDLVAFVRHQLPTTSSAYSNLKAKHFLYDGNSQAALDLLPIKIRTKRANQSEFTKLHLFVVTLRCDYSCQYCQVSRQTDDKTEYDMSFETADRALDAVFKSPAKAIKLEMQGGEPLLNFPLICHIIENATERNRYENRDLRFVITTNLTFIDHNILEFCRTHRVHISTSLDGLESVHNKNRPRPGKNGYEITLEGIRNAQAYLGNDQVSAVMTTTEATLADPKGLVDAYIRANLSGIFLRPLSPYGFAIKTGQVNRYNMTRWLEFYKEALTYILEVNRNGYRLVEFYTQMIVTKLFSPFGGNYVDLQSPTGAGLAAIIYNYDGKVYSGDEARMLAESGDYTFQMGDLHRQTYEEIFLNENYQEIVESTVSESLPQCSECAYLPYCGTDPLYHYATQKDVIGHKAFSTFCQKNMGIFNHILTIFKNNPEDREILLSWYRP